MVGISKLNTIGRALIGGVYTPYNPPVVGTTLTATLSNPNTTGIFFGYSGGNTDQRIQESNGYYIVGGYPNSYVHNVSDNTIAYTVTLPADNNSTRAVAIDDTYFYVGIEFDDTVGTDAGSVAVYRRSDGGLQTTLYPTWTTPDSAKFGTFLTPTDSYVAVSAFRADSNSGRVEVFDKATWTSQYVLTNPNIDPGSAADTFGNGLHADDTHLLVAAALEDVGATNTGSVYLYNTVTGASLHTFAPSTAAANTIYGQRVYITPSYFVIATRAGQPGFVDVYNKSDYSLAYTIDNPDGVPATSDGFGLSLYANNDHIIVGNPFYNDGNASAGRVYIFDAIDGSLQSTVDNPNAFGTTAQDEFGSTLHYGTKLYIGAGKEDTALTQINGKIYIFE